MEKTKAELIEMFERISEVQAEDKEYRIVLYDSVLAINAKIVVELGTFQGSSTDALSRAVEKTGGKVYTIDNEIGGVPIAEAKQRLEGRANIEFIKGDSIAVGESWDKGDVDMVFCDSDHSYEQVMGELTVWEQYNPKIFLIHDTFYPDMTYAPPYYATMDYANKKQKKFFNIDNGQGLGVVIMIGEK